MKLKSVLAMLIVGTIAANLDARGFGGGFSGGGGGWDGAAGYGIRGAGGLDANGIQGSGGLWGDGIHGSGGLGGEGAGIYGGFRSGNGFRDDRGVSNSGGNFGGGFRPMSGEPSMGGMQGNFNASRQSFNSGLANMGVQTGGFRAGQFGPPPSAYQGFNSGAAARSESPREQLNSYLHLPSDMGMPHMSEEHSGGYAGSARGISEYKPAEAGGALGEHGAVAGPERAAAGERGASGHVYEGPNGTTIAHGTAGERGAVVGPNGAAAGGRTASGSVVKGPNGNTYAHGETASRGVAAGSNGVVAGSHVTGGTAVRGANGNVAARGGEVTRNWSAADLRVQGNYARSNFHDYNTFNHDWYNQHPNAWYAAGFMNGIWANANWSNVTGWFGQDWPAYGYMYGNDLTYENNNVCLYGQPIATANDYYTSAANIAQTGEQANIPNSPPPQDNEPAATDPAKAKWLSLGVFEAIPAGDKSSNMTFQLAVNKAGIIRGNFYDSKDQNVQRIEGSVDKKAQRVAWVVADKKNIIFDCGLYNLTKAETPVLVHLGKDKNEQWTFVRLAQKSEAINTQ